MTNCFYSIYYASQNYILWVAEVVAYIIFTQKFKIVTPEDDGMNMIYFMMIIPPILTPNVTVLSLMSIEYQKYAWRLGKPDFGYLFSLIYFVMRRIMFLAITPG